MVDDFVQTPFGRACARAHEPEIADVGDEAGALGVRHAVRPVGDFHKDGAAGLGRIEAEPIVSGIVARGSEVGAFHVIEAEGQGGKRQQDGQPARAGEAGAEAGGIRQRPPGHAPGGETSEHGHLVETHPASADPVGKRELSGAVGEGERGLPGHSPGQGQGKCEVGIVHASQSEQHSREHQPRHAKHPVRAHARLERACQKPGDDGAHSSSAEQKPVEQGTAVEPVARENGQKRPHGGGGKKKQNGLGERRA